MDVVNNQKAMCLLTVLTGTSFIFFTYLISMQTYTFPSLSLKTRTDCMQAILRQSDTSFEFHSTSMHHAMVSSKNKTSQSALQPSWPSRKGHQNPIARTISWQDTYAQVHKVGITSSPAAKAAGNRPRWVVASVHPSAGLCNRIMNILSCMAFALATGRVLLFDWTRVEKFMHSNGVETMAHADFNQLFEHELDFSYTRARKNFENAYPTKRITYEDTAFLNALRFRNLDEVYPESVILIERFDWWARPLLANEFYSDVFQGVTFSSMFRYLLKPKQKLQPRGLENNCSVMVQHRTKWDRQTAPFEKFMECAVLNKTIAPQSVYITTDSQETAVRTSGQHCMPVGCRDGLDCDVQALQTMYALADSCPRAILTATSTFGACIASLGDMHEVSVVHSDGRCETRNNQDFLSEAGVLQGEPRQITEVMDASQNPCEFKGAIVLIMYESSQKSIQEMQEMLRNLHKHYNSQHHYPIVIFVDNADAEHWKLMQFSVSPRVHIVQVDRHEWVHQNTDQDAPEMFRIPSFPGHKGFNKNYRRMSRFAAGYMISSSFLERFDYVLKVDADMQIKGRLHKDPLAQLHFGNKKIAFWRSYGDVADVGVGLWDAFVEYVRSKKLQIRQPGILMHETTGEYLYTNLYGCMLGFRVAEFRSREYIDLFEWFNAKNGFMLHRWDEQKIFAFYVALYMTPEEVEYMDYVQVAHQEWAAEPMMGKKKKLLY